MSTTLTKSTPMRMLERLNPGKSIEEIVDEALRRHETPEGAASELGVSCTTLRNWRRRLEIGDSTQDGGQP